MLTYWETLIATQSNIAVSDSYAQLWGKKSQSGYTVETYTGTLPATLQTVRGYLESYKIYGSTEQGGTPTPENPIVPSGCGVRTENLWDEDDFWDNGHRFVQSILFGYAYIVSPGTYTVSTNVIDNVDTSIASVFAVAANPNREPSITSSSNGVFVNRPRTVTVNEGQALWIIIRVDTQGSQDYLIWNRETFSQYWIMLNLGSTPLPYEPYGYKLPLTANGVEYPIYLGEVETTRRIKKLVLTGDEYWQKSNAYQGSFYAQIGVGILSENYTAYCSHLAFSTLSQYAKGKFCFNGGVIKNCNLWITEFDSDTTVNDLKSFLAAQYANGTPVTVWYVLTEPETAVVNEPLMKIGDYADTIDSTQTSVQIPTSAGETTISWAGEGLAPSEVELVYKVKR